MERSQRSEKARSIAEAYRGQTEGRTNDPEPYDKLKAVFPEYLDMTEEYLLADVMSRPGLSLREHCMIIIATLTAVKFEGGLKGHMNWALNVGISREEAVEIVMDVGQEAGWPAGVEVFKLVEQAYPGYLAEIKSAPASTRLSPKERSMVKLAALTARRYSERMKDQIRLSLQMGIGSEKILEVIMQVVPFAGWHVGVEAIQVARDVFASEAIEKVKPPGQEDRPRSLQQMRRKGQHIMGQLSGGKGQDFLAAVGDTFPDFLGDITEGHLFGEVWSRPALDLRERCMITLALLIAFRSGDGIKAHMRYALNAGVSREEILEIIMHTANYTCWGSGVEALRLAEDLLPAKE